MSYGISVCPKCGGEVKTYEGSGGTCYNCGTWVSVAVDDGDRIMRENVKFLSRKFQQVCSGRFSVYLYGYDSVVIRVKRLCDTYKIDSLMKDYTRWGTKGYWKGREGDYYQEVIGFNKSADFDGYKLRPYEKEY